MKLLTVLVGGFFLSTLCIRLAIRLAPRLGLLDEPGGKVQQVHDRPIPRVGGWGIVAGTLAPVLVLAPLDPLLEAYVVAGVLLFLVGIYDDARAASHYQKFLFQIIAVCAVVWHADMWIETMPYFGEVPPAFGKPFTVFAIVGSINAINHSDGLDGLAAGEGLISLVAILVLMAMVNPGDPFVVVTFAVIGGVLGFLPLNLHPARVFMGDAGSQFLGFSLGVLAVHATQSVDVELSPALTLLFLGFPVVDILVVLALRVCGGMHWFRASRNHVHHRLLDCGLGQRGAVRRIWLVHTVLVASALPLRHENDYLVTGWYLLVCFVFYRYLARTERRRSQRD